MGLVGNLEDISLVDVLQLLHLSQKSGTLNIVKPPHSAQIIFLYGKITAATTTAIEKHMDSKLIEMGVVDAAIIDRCIEYQKKEAPDKLLGQILLDLDLVTFDKLQKALKSYIQEVISYIIEWNSGDFTFEMDNVKAVDEIGFFPESIQSKIDYDTQGLILDSLRVLDERNRKDEEQRIKEAELKAQEQVAAEKADEEEIQRVVDIALDSGPIKLKRRVILFNSSGFVRHTIKDICAEDDITIYIPTSVSEVYDWVQHCLSDHVIPLLVIDVEIETERLTDKDKGIEYAKEFKKQYPEIPVIMFGDGKREELYEKCLELGARTFIPKPTREDEHKKYVSEMDNFLKRLRAAFKGVFVVEKSLEDHRAFFSNQFKKLKERIQNLRKHEQTSTVSLEVLHFIADYFDRGIIFLVRENSVAALGAFGSSNEGTPLPNLLAKLNLKIEEGSAFKDVIDRHVAYRGRLDERIEAHKKLLSVIGEPKIPEGILLPMVVNGKAAVLIYADNGSREDGLLEYDSFQIFAYHAGIILENMLLKKMDNLSSSSAKAK